ncbi:hypothetical protein MHYP_G00158080 [Metynnis hypsauchen]
MKPQLSRQQQLCSPTRSTTDQLSHLELKRGKEGKKEEQLVFDIIPTRFALPTKTDATGTHRQTGCPQYSSKQRSSCVIQELQKEVQPAVCVKQSSAHACNMSGGPPRQKPKNPGPRAINATVNGRVQNMPILENNEIGGRVVSILNYNGPPPPAGVGAGSGPPQQEYAADGSINITNEGSFINRPIMRGNRITGSVDIGADINIQPPAAQNNRVKEEGYVQPPAAQNNHVQEEDDVQPPAAQNNHVQEEDDESMDIDDL